MGSVKAWILSDVRRKTVLLWHVKYWNLVDNNYIIFVKSAVQNSQQTKVKDTRKNTFDSGEKKKPHSWKIPIILK